MLTSNRSSGRLEAFERLLGPGSVVLGLGGGEAVPDLARVDALIVDGQPGAREGRDLERIGEWVRAGGVVVAVGATSSDRDGFWGDLLGAASAPPPPPGEYALQLIDTASGLTVRLPGESLVTDALTPLDHLHPEADVLARVSVRFEDRVVLAERRVGRGRVVVAGVGNLPAALAHPVVETTLRRALSMAPPPGSGTVGLAVVGYGPYGGMGYYHGLAASHVPGLALVATVDPSAERRKAAEDDFPGVRSYETIDELVTDDAVDAVVIATPPAAHATLALRLLRAGRHVACEKPMCLTTTEADELIATASAHDLMLTVNQNRRWDPDFVAIRRALDAGMLGELFNVETFVGGFDHPCRAWHSEVSVSGGAVYDWGSHHVDWILQLYGSMPERISCQGHKRVWHDVTNLDQLRLRMLWADGREAEFFQSDVAAIRKPKFYVQGTAGTLVGNYRPVRFERIEMGRGYVAEEAHHAEAPAELTLARYEPGFGLTTTSLPVAPEQRFAFHRNLADHLLLGEPLAVPAEGVRRVIAVLEAAQRSSDAGGTEIRPQ
ncbi:MAG: hypothetical protein NVS3B12_00950 [Acidimicrobiales bacterium]